MSQIANPNDQRIREIQLRIREQKDRLGRKIVQGTIAQSDDDLLREMYMTLKEMQAARLPGRST